jgi:hypothetical protein
METSIEDFGDRREFMRHAAVDEAQAFVAVRPEFRKLGALTDVSQSGLGFRYALLNGQELMVEKATPVKIDFFVSNNGFYLPKVNCRLAYDRYVENASVTGWGVQYCHCGLEFTDMTEGQKVQIERFLREYTDAEKGRMKAEG